MFGRDIRSRKVAADRYRPSRSGHGFTMVELIVVMVLVGILGAIAASRFFGRGTFEAAGFADQSGAILRFAQKEAIAQNRYVYARLDGASISLCYQNQSPCAQGNRVIPPYQISTDSTYCTAADQYCVRGPANVTYKVARGGADQALPSIMAFDALGRPLDGPSSAQLGVATTITIAAATESATVTIEPDTGYVH